jgi:hypothetical protein
MNTAEEVAVRWLVQHVNTLTCGHCDGRWLVPRSGPGILYHRCAQPRRRGLDPTWSREALLDEDRQRWAERQLGVTPITAAIETELGDNAYLDMDDRDEDDDQ